MSDIRRASLIGIQDLLKEEGGKDKKGEERNRKMNNFHVCSRYCFNFCSMYPLLILVVAM